MWGVNKDWCLFLDRDGVINKKLPDDYVKNPEEFEFIEGVPEAIAKLSKIFGKVFVVTNQQGIGKGLMTESNLNEIHDYMLREIEKHGGQITKCYFAPALASQNTSLRKPNPGMALLARRDFPGTDFKLSVMVGDSDSDIEFGRRLGMKTVKIDMDKKDASGADVYCENLVEFANTLIK